MRMSQCKNLDDFYDVLFLVEDTYIKANSLILRTRSPYFSSMLSPYYGFKEASVMKGSSIRVVGVSKSLFSCVLQYIYSDHFYIQSHTVEFFVQLFIIADYFMLTRLVDICSSYLKTFVNCNTALSMMLLAHAHNAEQLERYCLHFIAMNQEAISGSQAFHNFRGKADISLFDSFNSKIQMEVETSFVQISVANLQSSRKESLSQSEQQHPFKRQKPRDEFVNSQSEDNSIDEIMSIENILCASDYIYLQE